MIDEFAKEYLHGDLREALLGWLRVLPRASPVLKRGAEVFDLSLKILRAGVVSTDGSVDGLCHYGTFLL